MLICQELSMEHGGETIHSGCEVQLISTGGLANRVIMHWTDGLNMMTLNLQNCSILTVPTLDRIFLKI